MASVTRSAAIVDAMTTIGMIVVVVVAGVASAKHATAMHATGTTLLAMTTAAVTVMAGVVAIAMTESVVVVVGTSKHAAGLAFLCCFRPHTPPRLCAES
jgi:hypothetical protein